FVSCSFGAACVKSTLAAAYPSSYTSRFLDALGVRHRRPSSSPALSEQPAWNERSKLLIKHHIHQVASTLMLFIAANTV
ncbi:hypothetical protein, partial [Phascolarctobacterium sp.]|uniref:hypothetical protein n=1 Tax=Phascolarctobacterium sp. TaxID=2049039 RepID=UPI0025FE3E43